MSKFHTNFLTGTTNVCHAEEGKCPLSAELGEELVAHTDSVKEARAAYEAYMEKTTDMTAKLTKNADKSTSGADKPRSVLLNEQVEELNKAMKVAEKADPQYKVSDEYFEAAQRRRMLMFAKFRAEKEEFDALDEDAQKTIKDAKALILAQKMARRAENRAKRDQQNPYSAHPTITPKNEKPAQHLLTVLSGISEEELNERVATEVASGASLHDAYQKLWKELPLRTDKPIVMIDLETAAAVVDGEVDHGRYSEIIEFGGVRRNPDGTTKEIHFYSGVAPDLMAAVGTGAEEIHHISPDRVRGLPRLVDDIQRQAEIKEFLKGSIWGSHNLSYEMSNLKYSIPGFAKSVADGEFETFDTKLVCQYFVPEAANNSNQSFVTATGGVYKDAHSALPDAQMSLEALLRTKNVEVD